MESLESLVGTPVRTGNRKDRNRKNIGVSSRYGRSSDGVRGG